MSDVGAGQPADPACAANTRITTTRPRGHYHSQARWQATVHRAALEYVRLGYVDMYHDNEDLPAPGDRGAAVALETRESSYKLSVNLISS